MLQRFVVFGSWTATASSARSTCPRQHERFGVELDVDPECTILHAGSAEIAVGSTGREERTAENYRNTAGDIKHSPTDVHRAATAEKTHDPDDPNHTYTNDVESYAGRQGRNSRRCVLGCWWNLPSPTTHIHRKRHQTYARFDYFRQ